MVIESRPLVLAVASVFGSSSEMYLPAMAALASSFSPARHEWHWNLETGQLEECKRGLKGTAWHIIWDGKAQHSTEQRSITQLSMTQHATHSATFDSSHACLPLTFVWLILNLSAYGVCASEDG